MRVDALYHHQVVLLVRAVDPRGAQDYPREILKGLQECLGLYLRHTVAGVGLRYHAAVKGGVACLVAGAESRERRHVDEFLRLPDNIEICLGEIAQIVAVDAVEIREIDTFGRAQVIYHIVPRVSLELFGQLVGVVVVECYEFERGVGEIAPRGRFPHAAPCLIASPERFGRDEAADEASGTYNQYFLHISCENSWMYWSVIFSVPKRSSTERCSSSRGMSALRAHMIPSAMSAESL